MSSGLGRVGRFLLPTKDAEVVRYLYEHLLVPHGRHMRLRRAVLPWLPRRARDALILERWLHGCADEAPAMPPRVWTIANDLARAAGLPDRSESRWILLADRASARRMQLTLFLFPPDAPLPDAVLKVRTPGTSSSSLKGEWDALVRVPSRAPTLRGTLPTPLAYAHSDLGEAMLVSCMDGASAYMQLKAGARPGRVEWHFVQAARWLARLHDSPDHVTRPTQLVPTHGDFWPHNVLVSREGELTGVVDWEHCIPAGPRYLDLFHFPLSYALHYSRRTCDEQAASNAFRTAFLEHTRLAASVRRYLEVYCDLTGLDPAALSPLLDAYLMSRGLPIPRTPHRGSPAGYRAAQACRSALACTKRPAFLPSCAHSS